MICRPLNEQIKDALEKLYPDHTWTAFERDGYEYVETGDIEAKFIIEKEGRISPDYIVGLGAAMIEGRARIREFYDDVFKKSLVGEPAGTPVGIMNCNPKGVQG